jgi:hypothetical protein
VSDDVPCIPADFFSGVINPDFGAQIFHFSPEAKGNVALLTRETVDFDELDEEVLESVLIDQKANLQIDVKAGPQKTKT